MTDDFVNRSILLIFGGIFLASFAMLFSWWRILRAEFHDACAHGQKLRRDRPFLMALFLVIGSVALMGVSAIRAMDGINGMHLGGTEASLFALSLALLWASRTGFHWAATFDVREWQWWLYVASVVAWSAWVILR